ncbi:MAG: hypothetical protein EON50_15580 [Acidovorax sp.]|nr:MAG: hypothetical protein EON50_15580 [Acidovorax sp.]
MRVTFFRVAERKSPKKGRPPVCDPFASLRGNLRRGGCGVRRGTRFALARAARTATASQLTRHGRCDAHAHPPTAPPQAQPAGGGQPNIQTSTRAIAALGPERACASRRDREAERSNGPYGCPPPVPSGCAEERSGQRIRARDCLSEASSSETPLDASTAGFPARPKAGWGRRL